MIFTIFSILFFKFVYWITYLYFIFDFETRTANVFAIHLDVSIVPIQFSKHLIDKISKHAVGWSNYHYIIETTFGYYELLEIDIHFTIDDNNILHFIYTYPLYTYCVIVMCCTLLCIICVWTNYIGLIISQRFRSSCVGTYISLKTINI